MILQCHRSYVAVLSLGLGMLIAAFHTAAATAGETSNQALLIGVSDYELAPLSNPVNDVKAIAQALEAKGWEATVLQNPSLERAREAIKALAQTSSRLGEDASILVYFSGHGFQMGSDSYVLFDGSRGDLQSIVEHSLNVSDLIEGFDSTPAAKILLLDACRTSPFGDATVPALSAGLTQLDAPTNSVIGFATAPYRVAYDTGTGASGLSPYAASVVGALGDSETIDEFFRAVRRSTILATEGRQVPWETSSLLHNMMLGGAGTVTTTAAFPRTDVSTLSQTTQALSDVNSKPTVDEDFGEAVVSFLTSAVASASLSDYVIWGGRPATEQDRSDLLETIRWESRNGSSQWFFGNMGFQMVDDGSGFNPACRDSSGLDFDCSDSDRQLFLPLDPAFVYRVNRYAYEIGGRTDGLAKMYRDGIFVPRDYLKAYDVYADARGRLDDAGGRFDDYWAVDVNSMAQEILNSLGASLTVDGDFGSVSCAALRQRVAGAHCGDVVSRKDFAALVALLD